MSHTKEWSNRMENYHYSQDDRTLSYKYQRELEGKINKFLSDPKENELQMGSFNLTMEPWRLLAISDFRKFGLQLVEKHNKDNDMLTDIKLVKKKRLY
jgi:hypothetical protein